MAARREFASRIQVFNVQIKLSTADDRLTEDDLCEAIGTFLEDPASAGLSDDVRPVFVGVTEELPDPAEGIF